MPYTGWRRLTIGSDGRKRAVAVRSSELGVREPGARQGRSLTLQYSIFEPDRLPSWPARGSLQVMPFQRRPSPTPVTIDRIA